MFADKNGCEYVHMKEAAKVPSKDDVGRGLGKGEGKWDARPEIDRERLQEILLMGVGESRVRWRRKVKSVRERMVEFEGGEVEGPFDLIVGADGAFSKVSHVLTEVRPRYSGICGLDGHIVKPKDIVGVDELVGRGSYFTYSDGKALMAQRLGDDSVKVGMWVKREKEWVESLWKEKAENIEELKNVMLEEFREWTEEMKDWIRASSTFRKWVLWELRVGHTWEHKEGYTLLGDAAHLCTPFAGLGVNAAMKDALDLSEQIIESVSGGTLDEAVKKYEQEMFPRAKEVQTRTMQNKEGMFSPDAPVGMMAAFVGVVGAEVGWPVDQGVLRWVPITKIVYAGFWLLGAFGALRRRLQETFWPK